MQKRCYICSSYFKKDSSFYRCQCGIKVHEVCAIDNVHCPVCDRLLIFITDADDVLGG